MISVSRTPALEFAFSMASTAASGFFSDSSIAFVVARRNRLTMSGLDFNVSVLTMMPELIRLTP